MFRTMPVIEGAAARSRNLSVDDEITLYVPVRGYLRFLPERTPENRLRWWLALVLVKA